MRGGADAIPRSASPRSTDGALVGTIQCWPVALHGDDGSDAAAGHGRPGRGRARRASAAASAGADDQALDAAIERGLDGALMLIGDPEYYGRFFGFSAERTAGWRLPGPVERRRLLARGAGVPAVRRHAAARAIAAADRLTAAS